MADILHQILAHKRTEIAAVESLVPLAAIRTLALEAAPARRMGQALKSPDGRARIIAECKRQSPSRGVMVQDYDPATLAKAYAAGGAAAISVLTDERFFGGHLEHLKAVREAVDLPILRKDFVLGEYQVYEARAYGADSFLLISGPLSASELEHLIQLGRSLGMEPLVESHTDVELRAALTTSATIFGINNRDLNTFTTDLKGGRALVDEALRQRPDATLVCESGIKRRPDVEAMQTLGYNVFLIGEALVTHPDPRTAVQTLIG